jgi:hypothetical protein
MKKARKENSGKNGENEGTLRSVSHQFLTWVGSFLPK